MYKLELYLLRHGRTICNEQKLYCGFSDISLSELGLKELLEFKKISDENYSNKESTQEKIINKFTYPKCDKYYSSGAKRANETFETLYPNENYEIIKEFFEYNFGDFEMKSYEMLKENKDYINWIMDNEGTVTVLNGESKSEYRKRISIAFIKLINKCSLENVDSALLVSHGGTIGTILELFYSNKKSFYEWQPSCGLGYNVIVLYDEEKDYIKIESINKIDYLT